MHLSHLWKERGNGWKFELQHAWNAKEVSARLLRGPRAKTAHSEESSIREQSLGEQPPSTLNCWLGAAQGGWDVGLNNVADAKLQYLQTALHTEFSGSSPEGNWAPPWAPFSEEKFGRERLTGQTIVSASTVSLRATADAQMSLLHYQFHIPFTLSYAAPSGLPGVVIHTLLWEASELLVIALTRQRLMHLFIHSYRRTGEYPGEPRRGALGTHSCQLPSSKSSPLLSLSRLICPCSPTLVLTVGFWREIWAAYFLPPQKRMREVFALDNNKETQKYTIKLMCYTKEPEEKTGNSL